MVAYELFMRSIADHPSESVFKETGLQGGQISNALNYLESFERAMSLYDQGARTIKTSQSGTDKLAQLQKKKEEYLERELNQYLPKVLGAEGNAKIRSYINTQVKPKTKKVPSGQNAVYVYANAWQDGDKVYGSGTITSDYSNLHQYLVTTTVIAPDGNRSSTTQTGWDYAAVTGTEYLPIMPNDGTFTVESVFEGTDGFVASASNTEAVAPLVSITKAAAVPATISGPARLSIVAEIQFSEGVPAAAEAIVELNEASNLQKVLFEVKPPSGVGVTGTNNTRVARVSAGGGPRTIVWPLNVTSIGSNSFPTLPNVVKNDVRIDSVTMGVATGVDTMSVPFTITAPAPSPSPSP